MSRLSIGRLLSACRPEFAELLPRTLLPFSIQSQSLSSSSSAETGEKKLKLGFIGAGGVNFGTPEGSWNHAVRLNTFPDVEFTAIVDPNTQLAMSRVSEYSSAAHPDKWENCEIFDSYSAMLQSKNKPDAVFIGLPPEFHGSIDDSSANIEIKLAEAGVHLFVEKPLSVKPPEEVQALSARLQELQKQHKLIIAVGYMLRYSPAVEMAKKLLEENDTPIALLVGRYVATYNHILKKSWWDTALSGGTIVEQATHFVDLHRYLGGEIDHDSILATAVGPDYPLTAMAPHPQGENLVPPERRVNRVTSATWRFETGAVGSLTHSCLQHEQNFFTTFEILADGLHIIIGDPYNVPTIKVRRKHSNDYEDIPLDTSKDMYVNQFEGFLKAVRTGDENHIRCSYATAALTYQASQWITIAANKNRNVGPWSRSGQDAGTISP